MKTCFVVMPIGEIPNVITQADLRARYDDVIKEAVLKAWPSLDVTRADDVAAPGTINTDIITRIMHSDLVLADVTFPNANVFYELGMRHAVRPGTILIKERDGKGAPFDIHTLRHIPYDTSATGLKQLADELRKQIDWIAKNPHRPDSAFLELAHFTKYPYPKTDPAPQVAPEKQTELLMRIATNPRLAAVLQAANGRDITFDELREMIEIDAPVMQELITTMVQAGKINVVKNG